MNIQGNINAIIGTLASLKLDTERNKELKQARQATEAMNKKLEEERKQFEQSPEGRAYEENRRWQEEYDERRKRGEIDEFGNPIITGPGIYRDMNGGVQTISEDDWEKMNNNKSHDPETYNAASINRVMNRAIQKKVALKHRTKLKGGRN